MNFMDTDDFGTMSYLRSFSVFKDHRGKIRNLCQKKSLDLKEDFNIFDYAYTVSTGKSSVTYEFTVFFANSKFLGLPEFKMKPENFGHKLMALLGWNDINFEEYPIFSNKYHLTGSDEYYIRHRFNDNVLKFFSKASGWTVEAVNYYLVFYSWNKLVDEKSISDFYKVGCGVYELFKDESDILDSQF